MSLVGHLVALNKLPAAGMTCYDDHFQVCESIFASEFANDFIDNIERRNSVVINGMSAHSPPVGRLLAIPIQFVSRQRIAAVAHMIGGKSRCDDDCILEGAS